MINSYMLTVMLLLSFYILIVAINMISCYILTIIIVGCLYTDNGDRYD